MHASESPCQISSLKTDPYFLYCALLCGSLSTAGSERTGMLCVISLFSSIRSCIQHVSRTRTSPQIYRASAHYPARVTHAPPRPSPSAAGTVCRQPHQQDLAEPSSADFDANWAILQPVCNHFETSHRCSRCLHGYRLV
jgi:hypothetical protein